MATGDSGRAPSAAAEQSLVESFCAVTSATPEEAAFFLENHNWVLESAVRSFYDSADGDGDANAADPAPPPPPRAAGGDAESEGEDYVGGGGDEDKDDEDAALAAAAAAAEERRRPVKRQKRSHDARGGSGSRSGGASGRGNVRTLFDLGGGKRGAGSDEDSEEDDEWAPPPEYYTGGEKSGMVVRDQSKRKNNADEIFKQAKRKGAKQGPFEARRRSSSSSNFTGTGRFLSGETVQPDALQPPEDIVHNIYFWRNGFTVNDGPLRSFDDPANASFLESIKNSECPIELEPADGKSKVNVNLVRKEEECPEPVERAAPFQGEQTLMAPSDNTSNAAASTEATAPRRAITVDDSLPSTSLNIRFADGNRRVARFNTSHTIGDVRSFIDATMPEVSDYTLQAGFPPKPLDDTNKTIDEAGVANSLIIQFRQ
ncbi:plant UBX domain-containing protein 4-like isoform X2 [Phragmites australis]|uniref:plant UBX domain-containing protein 4-like isoform X2 n=1 Tax=Phragmites australis TaxID=29695 RepID=UPI002D787B28|nr:plant UBX domain-containing protein 4-like isoform X2 [Phragmites australis]